MHTYIHTYIHIYTYVYAYIYIYSMFSVITAEGMTSSMSSKNCRLQTCSIFLVQTCSPPFGRHVSTI